MNSLPIIVSVISALIAISSVIWTVTYNIRQVRRIKVDKTHALFEFYYSHDFLAARDFTWFWLDDYNLNSQAKPFGDLWTDSNKGIREDFDRLYRVLSFWLLLWGLDKSNELNRQLTADLLGYQYVHWKRQIRTMVNLSRQDWDDVDVIRVFSSNELDWLALLSNRDQNLIVFSKQ